MEPKASVIGYLLVDESYMHVEVRPQQQKIISVFKPLQDNVNDQHWIPPSPVVHVRGLGEAVVEADLVEALQKFGNIWYDPMYILSNNLHTHSLDKVL